MYSREINGEEFTFGVSGKLIMNVLVMYDRQTDSLWSQLLGEAVDGKMKGTKLEFLPAWHTTWAEWVERHPESLALRKGFYGGYDSYESYYNSASAGVIGRSESDDRLYTKEFVIGVEQQGESVAYPFRALNDEPVVNDKVGEVPVLVVFDTENAAGVVYERSLDGQMLTFKQAQGQSLVIQDEETGTTWDGFTGQALDGPLAGENLPRIKSTSSFWFGWVDFYPETRVYGVDIP